MIPVNATPFEGGKRAIETEGGAAGFGEGTGLRGAFDWAPGGGSSASATAKPKAGDAASANFNKSPNRQTATEMARAALRDL